MKKLVALVLVLACAAGMSACGDKSGGTALEGNAQTETLRWVRAYTTRWKMNGRPLTG